MTSEQVTAARKHFKGAAKIACTPPAAKFTPKAHRVSNSPNRNKLNHPLQQAAERYKPDRVRLLLVAETPPVARPPDPPRYFYFENVSKHDGLFRGVVRAVLNVEPDRASKSSLLDRLRQQGVFLIDLKVDPTDTRPLTQCVPDLVERCRHLKPDRIILIKSNVYDEAFASLRAAKLPVVDARIPFPDSGQQAKFAKQMTRALDAAHGMASK